MNKQAQWILRPIKGLWIAERKLCDFNLLNLLGNKRGSTRGEPSRILASSGNDGQISCPSLTTVYSMHFHLKYGVEFGIWMKATSASGTPALKIILEQSYIAPAPEGASDTNWVVGDGVADIYSNLNDQNAHIKTVSPVPMKHGRLNITGIGSNPADTLLSAYLFIQEQVF